MRHLNDVYTQRFNKIHKHIGHVFQDRYKAILVEQNSYLLELSRYIVLNPVRARMVRSAKDWPWNSYRTTARQSTPVEWLYTNWLLSAFSHRKDLARKRYCEFVAEGKNQPPLWEQLKSQIYLGSDKFVEAMQSKADDNSDLSEIPLFQKRKKFKSLGYYYEKYKDRNTVISIVYASGGYNMKDIGDYFNLHYSRVSRIIKSMSKAKGKT